MVQDAVVDTIAIAIREARDGVEYDAKHGAACPYCGKRLRVSCTMRWLDRSRKRYHKCVNAKCPLCIIDATVTSWQEA